MPKYEYIEGKIFIHSRYSGTINWGLHQPVDSIAFNCFIQNQNFNGNFCGLHCNPADQIRAIYIEVNQKKIIIGLYNTTQRILHLHPKRKIYPRLSWPKLGISFIQIICFLLCFLFCVFIQTAWQNGSFDFFSIMNDVFYFTAILASAIIILTACTTPILYLLYWPNFRETSRQLQQLQLTYETIQSLTPLPLEAGVFKQQALKIR